MKIIVQKTAILLVCLLLGISGLLAQNKLKFSIASFEADPFDASAKDPRYEKIDGNGDRYAIIKVTSNNPDDDLNEYQFNFGNLRSSTIMKDDVLWVYVQKNAKLVTISRSGYTTVNRYDLRTTIEAGKNYVMSLTSAEKRVMTQMVQFNIEPADSRAVVMVKSSVSGATEELFGNADASGAVARSLEYGIYTYKVFAKNYNTSEGRLTINEKDRTHVEQVVLVPNFSVMTLRVDADAEIYVNGELKATRQWAGPLRAGNYQVECRQANHTPSSQYITVVENDNRTIDLAAPTPIVGTVAITSNPLGADITIDGKAYGKTPRNIDIVIGKHNVALSKPSYKTEQREFEVTENHITNVDMMLGSIANVTITCNPSWAALYIDNDYKGSTPYNYEGSIGQHRVKLACDGYKSFDKSIYFGNEKELSFSLRKQTVSKTDRYFAAGAGIGSSMNASAALGMHLNNINFEVYYNYCWKNSDDIYWHTDRRDGVDSYPASYKPSYMLGGKVGYGIIAGTNIKVTPQIGYRFTKLSESCQYFIDGAYCSSATVGVRAYFAVSSHFGISITPEYAFELLASDGFKTLEDISSKIGDFAKGINANLSLVVTF